MPKQNSKFSVVAKGDDAAEITLYDVIDRFWGISASDIYGRLKNLGDVKHIAVRINSPGGSIIEGTAIYNLLKQNAAKVTVKVDGIAASMASVVAMAGDEIEIGEGAYLMIHDPLGDVYSGDSEDMREMADTLDKMKSQLVDIYANRTGRDAKAIRKMMKAETWMTAAEAIDNGFADRAVEGLKIAATASTALFNRVPQALLKTMNKETDMADSKPTAATFDEIKAVCIGADSEFLCKQLEAKATATDAATAWMQEQELRRAVAVEEAEKLRNEKAESDKAAAEAKAEVDRLKASKPGVQPLGGGQGGKDTSDPAAAWKNAVADKQKAGLSKAKASSAVARENPELHEAYIAAVNQ